ncbi:aspartate-semialdehyde dehydrogenase [Hyphobacterium sp. CCMP332]|jgi:aspartate-semialdehyde dehydrogenase|uniref:aspartate-semialdehyde dehydrogenase n=1 Tax=Hyphobacterium sp. CCMP332 TaxID=2749086 RepID=UPI0016508236|nr:aspartate-semialdehyde dehydrogenase [Hyphobacterium sp. CCMP332]QNL19748.1 aspartate-semialdehyde dehydrogenase [Hyphobacterium sp. CCMP332]
MGLKVAVLGATGAVGKEMLTILAERLFPADEIHALATRKSMGVEVSYGDRDLKVKDVATFDFSTVDLVLISAGADVALDMAPKIAAAGAIVIDNSSAFRMDPDVPLVVPEVNPDALEGVRNKRIVANPNCSTIQMVVALKPLHDLADISRISVSTYQSVSGAGNAAMDELWRQTRGIFVNDGVEKHEFTKQIAFNVIPRIGDLVKGGATTEEQKMVDETHKMLDPDIRVIASCVRVPVFVGHGMNLHVEFNKPVSAKDARDLLRESPGLMLVDNREDDGFVTPVECVGEFAVFVSRVREDPTVEHGLAMWVVCDNLRKGAALNAVQIAEALNNRGLIG